MKVFFDCEFTGLHKDTTLISIGLISQDGDKFYAELTDYDVSQVDEWIECNVINHLLCKQSPKFDFFVHQWYHLGTKDQISKELSKWLSQFDSVEFISDVCHYDMVLLIDLIGGHAFNVPKHVSPSCHDINQDIARYYDISEKEAFDMNRAEIIFNESGFSYTSAHFSLNDAYQIKDIYNIIHDNWRNENDK